jgi:hypothetical protein
VHVVILRPPPRFPKRPQLPPDEILPDGWSESELDRLAAGATVIWSGAYELRKVHIVFGRVPPTGVQTDVAITTMHLLNLTDDAPDATWVDADFVAAETALDAFWTTMKDYYSSGTFLDQYRWYKAGPAFTPTPPEGNPPVRIIERNVPGTNTSSWPFPPQVAVTVTEKTALRKHWGRMYLPAPVVGTSESAGTVGPSFGANLIDVVEDLYEAFISADLVPVVFSPTNESAYQVEHLQVDNLFDVMRSRRWKAPSTRWQRDLTD